ncbi:MAG: cupin domain-containing protein [Pseudomonadota bacterium]
MDQNSDFSKRVAVHYNNNPWVPSPAPGVARKVLDRLGGEVARATTIVRFDPDSAFAAHTHAGGEEFIVLEGVFQDEHGDFPAGTYVRNPPTSAHTPASKPGCTIFVKLWQFDPDDRTQVALDMASVARVPDPARPGVRMATLFQDEHERVTLEAWDAETSHQVDAEGGAEALVLEGSLREGGQEFLSRDWLRIPVGHCAPLSAGPDGALIWVKTGHLAHIRSPDG